jgi:hypothetical protein
MSQEARREQILKVREENKQLAKRVEQGTTYSEPLEVYFTDHVKHTVQVYAMSEREFTEVCKKTGTTPDVFQTSPEVSNAQVKYNAMVAEHGEESEEAKEALTNLTDARQKHPMKSEHLIGSLEFVLAMADVSTHDPDMTTKLLGNREASKIAVKAFQLMNPPKD